MICVRCGFCCLVAVRSTVIDPEGGIKHSNWENEFSGRRCRHLHGNRPGELVCAIHHLEIYRHTSCARNTPEADEKGVCKRGKFLVQKFKDSGASSWAYEDYVDAVNGFIPAVP